MKLALALVLMASGCAFQGTRLQVVPRCADGLPPRPLIDVACPPNGICGFSCAPSRWAPCVEDACTTLRS